MQGIRSEHSHQQHHELDSSSLQPPQPLVVVVDAAAVAVVVAVALGYSVFFGVSLVVPEDFPRSSPRCCLVSFGEVFELAVAVAAVVVELHSAVVVSVLELVLVLEAAVDGLQKAAGKAATGEFVV